MGSPERLKIDVLLLLFERPEGVPLHSLHEEFLRFHGRQLDLRGHGYPTLAALIGDMSGMVDVREGPGSLRLLARVPGSSVGARGGTGAAPRPGERHEPRPSVRPEPRPSVRPEPRPSVRPEPRPCLFPDGPPVLPCVQGAGLLGAPLWRVPGAFGRLPFTFPLWSPLPPAPRAQAWAYLAPRPPPAPGTEAVDGGGEARAVTAPGPPPDEAGRAQGERGQPMTYSQALRSRRGGGGQPEGVGGGGGTGAPPERRPEPEAYRMGGPGGSPPGAARREGWGGGEAARPHSKIPAGRSQEAAERPGGPVPGCPAKEWLLSVLRTKGYRDGLYAGKLAVLCLKQMRLELTDFLTENGYRSLEELLAQLPEVEAVPGSGGGGGSRDVVVRLRAAAGPAAPGRGYPAAGTDPSARPDPAGQDRATFGGTEAGADHRGTSGPGQLQLQPLLERGQPQARRGNTVDGTGPSPAETQRPLATDGPALDGTREKLARVLAQRPGGLSLFQLRQAFRDIHSQALAPAGYPSLEALLRVMGDTVSVRGLGVQARLFPRQGQHTDPSGVAGSGRLTAELPEKIITETGFRASEGVSGGPARPS